MDPLAFELLFDPQTSGGLLLAAAAQSADALVRELRAAGDRAATCIGSVTPPRSDGKRFAVQ
jgi:selenide,water dikinase